MLSVIITTLSLLSAASVVEMMSPVVENVLTVFAVSDLELNYDSDWSLPSSPEKIRHQCLGRAVIAFVLLTVAQPLLPKMPFVIATDFHELSRMPVGVSPCTFDVFGECKSFGPADRAVSEVGYLDREFLAENLSVRRAIYGIRSGQPLGLPAPNPHLYWLRFTVALTRGWAFLVSSSRTVQWYAGSSASSSAWSFNSLMLLLSQRRRASCVRPALACWFGLFSCQPLWLGAAVLLGTSAVVLTSAGRLITSLLTPWLALSTWAHLHQHLQKLCFHSIWLLVDVDLKRQTANRSHLAKQVETHLRKGGWGLIWTNRRSFAGSTLSFFQSVGSGWWLILSLKVGVLHVGPLGSSPGTLQYLWSFTRGMQHTMHCCNIGWLITSGVSGRTLQISCATFYLCWHRISSQGVGCLSGLLRNMEMMPRLMTLMKKVNVLHQSWYQSVYLCLTTNCKILFPCGMVQMDISALWLISPKVLAFTWTAYAHLLNATRTPQKYLLLSLFACLASSRETFNGCLTKWSLWHITWGLTSPVDIGEPVSGREMDGTDGSTMMMLSCRRWELLCHCPFMRIGRWSDGMAYGWSKIWLTLGLISACDRPGCDTLKLVFGDGCQNDVSRMLIQVLAFGWITSDCTRKLSEAIQLWRWYQHMDQTFQGYFVKDYQQCSQIIFDLLAAHRPMQMQKRLWSKKKHARTHARTHAHTHMYIYI